MDAEQRTVAGERGSRKALLTVVVPTRNEAENVPMLIRELRESLLGVDYRIVFVDDSTDETPGVIRRFSEADGRITLIHRESAEREGGLSTAVTTGMDVASDGSEFICVMDADLQHPPQKVRQMLEVAIDSEADVVVASRYARGGDYSGLSGPLRKAVSKATKYLSQIVFNEARKSTDPLSGFFLVRNEAISGIQFRPTGFKMLLEILVCAPQLKVVEVPLKFRSRQAGVSKATFSQGLNYLAHMASLFWYVPSAGRFWKFAMVGASGVLVNNLTLIILAEYFDANKVIAWMFAVGVSILSNFLLNNAFTWRDVRHSSRIHFLLRGALAYPVAIMGIGANFAVYYPLLKYVSDSFPYYVLFNLLGIAAGTSVNFLLSSRLVFRPTAPKNLDPKAPPEQIAEEVRRELKADWIDLIRAQDLSSVAQSFAGGGGSTNARRELTTAERTTIELVLATSEPTLVVSGPKRLPQPRTNTRWGSTLVVPVFEGEKPVGVVYATRNLTEHFIEEDLHWLTAYVSTAGPVFAQ